MIESLTIKRLAAKIVEEYQDIANVFCEYSSCNNVLKKFHTIKITNSNNKKIKYDSDFLKILEALLVKIFNYDGGDIGEDVFGKIWIDFVNGIVKVQVFSKFHSEEIKSYEHLIDPIRKPAIEFNCFLKKIKKNKLIT